MGKGGKGASASTCCLPRQARKLEVVSFARVLLLRGESRLPFESKVAGYPRLENISM